MRRICEKSVLKINRKREKKKTKHKQLQNNIDAKKKHLNESNLRFRGELVLWNALNCNLILGIISFCIFPNENNIISPDCVIENCVEKHTHIQENWFSSFHFRKMKIEWDEWNQIRARWNKRRNNNNKKNAQLKHTTGTLFQLPTETISRTSEKNASRTRIIISRKAKIQLTVEKKEPKQNESGSDNGE